MNECWHFNTKVHIDDALHSLLIFLLFLFLYEKLNIHLLIKQHKRASERAKDAQTERTIYKMNKLTVVLLIMPSIHMFCYVMNQKTERILSVCVYYNYTFADEFAVFVLLCLVLALIPFIL